MADSDQANVRRGEAGSHAYLGVSADILAGAEHTGERFSMVELTLQPGAGMPRHDHPEVVVGWYVLAGTVTVDTDGGPLELASRDFLFDPPGFIHTVANRGEEPARLLLVFAPPGCEQFFVAAAEEFDADVPQTHLADDTLQTLAKLADRHGWQLDPDSQPVGPDR